MNPEAPAAAVPTSLLERLGSFLLTELELGVMMAISVLVIAHIWFALEWLMRRAYYAKIGYADDVAAIAAAVKGVGDPNSGELPLLPPVKIRAAWGRGICNVYAARILGIAILAAAWLLVHVLGTPAA